MGADIALGERPQQRIGERMQRHVAVRMRQHAAIMGDAHAAQPDMVTLREGVDVVAGADPHHHQPSCGRAAPVEILRMRQFQVGGLPGEGRDRMSGPFHQRCVVGEAVATGRERRPVGGQ
eukprot:gene19085-27037_t